MRYIKTINDLLKELRRAVEIYDKTCQECLASDVDFYNVIKEETQELQLVIDDIVATYHVGMSCFAYSSAWMEDDIFKKYYHIINRAITTIIHDNEHEARKLIKRKEVLEEWIVKNN